MDAVQGHAVCCHKRSVLGVVRLGPTVSQAESSETSQEPRHAVLLPSHFAGRCFSMSFAILKNQTGHHEDLRATYRAMMTQLDNQAKCLTTRPKIRARLVDHVHLGMKLSFTLTNDD